jgi:hypothetical protein
LQSGTGTARLSKHTRIVTKRNQLINDTDFSHSVGSGEWDSASFELRTDEL